MLDKIRKIKYLRLHPNEIYLNNLFNGVVVFKHKQYPSSIYYVKDDNISFEIRNDCVYIKNTLFWIKISQHLVFKDKLKNSNLIEEHLITYFKDFYDTNVNVVYVQCAYNNSWKHVMRSIKSSERKNKYI